MKMEDFDDTEYVASEHDKLVSAISKLDKTQHITEPTRKEPTNLSSEFNLLKRNNKLNLNNIAKVLEKTSYHTHVTKKLKKTQNETKVLNTPLEKPQAERVKRATGYEETKKIVGRWDPVVARSRTVDCISFPIKHVSDRLQPTREFISKFELKCDLEKELDVIDPPTVEEDEEEEEPIFPMTYEDMKEHRQHLAKMRAQQSYKAAKAKRQSKIKSKKYHRVLKKEKLKKQLEEFEKLQKSDPEEALKRLEAIEKARALERHTLRHKNTGKWAKNKLITAKYNKEVRQQIAEQLAVSRCLTQKIQDNESSDELDQEMSADITSQELDQKITADIIAQDPMNSWMIKRSDKSNGNTEFDFANKKFIQNKTNVQIDSNTDSDDNNEDGIVANLNANPIIDTQLSKEKSPNITSENRAFDQVKHKVKAPIANKDALKSNKRKSILSKEYSTQDKKNNIKLKSLVATSIWVVETVDSNTGEEISSAFENLETSVEKQVEKKLNKMRKNLERLGRNSHSKTKKNPAKYTETKERDNLEYLKLKNKNVKAIIDEELIETTSQIIDTTTNSENPDKLLSKALNVTQPVQENTDFLDPVGYEVNIKNLNTPTSQVESGFDQLDDDDDEQIVPRVNIEEGYEEDEFVASFRQEKEDEINKNEVEDTALSLPGWGIWGGKGVKPQKRKRNRFISKPAPKMPRRDENKGDIIIREYKDPKLTMHKVKDVPFPFESVKDYEASIRAPLGNTFIPEKAHKKLIRPAVITKAGTVIEPMDEDQLLMPKNRKFKNESIIKLLGQR